MNQIVRGGDPRLRYFSQGTYYLLPAPRDPVNTPGDLPPLVHGIGPAPMGKGVDNVASDFYFGSYDPT